MARLQRPGAEPRLGFGLVGEDEPVFIVRGQDLAAPATIEAWAKEALLHGAHPVITDMAVRWADRVRDWQRCHGAQAAWRQEGDA
ncbi:MAG: hypothetical protein QOG87_4157 [Actinomycetota bacterium]